MSSTKNATGIVDNLTVPIVKEEVVKTPVTELRNSYKALANDYNRLMSNQVICCPKCGTFKLRSQFYKNNNFVTGFYPLCKSCVMKSVLQIHKEGDVPHETKETVERMLCSMDLPYYDDLYKKCCANKKIKKNGEERSPFVEYLAMIIALPAYKNKYYRDSQFGSDGETALEDVMAYDEVMIKKARKNFGDFPEGDLIFLQEEFEDWTSKYEVHTKGQLELFKNLCFLQLQLNQARRTGNDTKDLIKQFQDVMQSLGIKPNQSNSDQLTQNKCFGQEIEYWEDEYKGGRPIPEASPEFKDINHTKKMVEIGAGMLAESSGIKNKYTEEYDEFMKKYSVEAPQERDDVQSQEIRDKLFGRSLEETEKDISGED